VTAQSGTYSPALEGKLWKELLPWGLNTGANGETIWADRKDLNNIPGSDPLSRTDTGDVNVYFDPIYQSLGPYGSTELSSMDAADIDFGRLVNQGECTFSHEADYDIHWSIYWPQVRICKGPEYPAGSGEFARLPPAPGRMLNPVGLATSGKKVFVTDLFNHRVQAFDFFGNHLPMTFPIGNGIPGNESYDYDAQYPGLNYRPYANVPGYENAGYSGHQLSGPAGIAVDSRMIGENEAPRLLIADSDNYRVALFNDDGSPAFLDSQNAPVHLELPVPVDGNNSPILSGNDPNSNRPYQFKPDQIAISAGATIRDPQLQAIIASDDPDFNKRIVVADRVHCFLAIMDVGFNVIKTFPPALPEFQQHDACQDNPDNQHPILPGEFSTITGVKVDSNGTIYVADNANNAIRVFDRNGNYITSVGQPGGSNPGTNGDLLGPVGVFVDEKFNRLGVIDQGHGRAVFYDLTNGPANVTFEFQIDTTVAVDDFPMGVIMQYGEAEDGLDPKGRIMVTDPYRRRVLRWELPELVIVNATADITNYDVNPKQGVGSFDVVVPYQKLSPVFDVRVNIVPVVPCQGASNNNCVRVVAGSVTPSLATRPDITHGTLVHYTFQFTATLDEAKFDITAVGCATDGCTTPTVQAPEVEAIARALCDECAATHEVFFESEDMENPDPAELVSTPPAVTDVNGNVITGWYNRPVFVRIAPANPDGTEETDPNRVVAIGWAYGGASATNYEPGLTEVEIPEGGFIDIPVGVTGVSWIVYKPITLSGAAGAPVKVLLPVDLQAPGLSFTNWPTPSGIDGNHHWYKTVVTGTYQLTDAHSGPQIPPAGMTVTFSHEGRAQSQVVPTSDRVGNFADVRSDDASRLGKPINIDMTAPVFNGTPVFQLAARGTDVDGDYVNIVAGRFMVAVTDPLLADGSAGSGTAPGVGNRAATRVRNGDTIYFDAVDKAGNASVGTATITLTERQTGSSTVSVVGGTFTFDGLGHPATQCIVRGDDGETFPGTLRYSPVNAVPVNAGTVTAHCEFAGNENYEAATPATAQIIINKRLPTVVTTGGTFAYNALARTSTCTVSNVIGSTPTGTVTYNGGSVAPINATTVAVGVRCDYAGDANHLPAFGTSSIVINPRPITIRTTSQTIFVTDLIPSFPYEIAPGSLTLLGNDALSGSLGGIPLLPVIGVYNLNLGTVTAGANYAVSLLPATLTIRALTLPPIAVNDSRSSVGAAPVTINVVSNDSDPDGLQALLRVVAFGQPVGGTAHGVVTQAADQVLVFTPAPTFVGTTTFNYTIADPAGATASAVVTITITAPTNCNLSGFTTFTQGGWGATPNGNNPAKLLQTNFARVYPGGSVSIGIGNTLTFTSSTAIKNFLPAGGTAGVLATDATNPTSSSAGVFAGQVLALQLSVDFSAAGVTKAGLGDLVYSGKSIYQILALANQVIGGDTAALNGTGWTLTQLNNIVDGLNNNFDNGTQNNGMVSCPTSGSAPGAPPPAVPNAAPDAKNDSTSTSKNTAKTISVLSNDTDANGDTLSVTAVSKPSKGSVTVNSNNTVTFTPAKNSTGTMTFTYTISDGKGGTDTATVTVTVG
jgi:hypothetical protein